jgi:hypothetical protein
MLQLTIAYVNQADREHAVEDALRTHQVLEAVDATPTIDVPVVTQRAAARPPRTTRGFAATGGPAAQRPAAVAR